MNSIAARYGNMPMSATALALEFPDIKKPGQKISLLERDGIVVRLKRDLYVCPEQVSTKALSLELIANRLLTPSYVSMLSALRFYGLIPEAVYVTQSMTTKEAREYNTPIGRFAFTRIKKEAFNIGIRTIEEDGYSFLIASPEKALCDLIAATPSLILRYRREALVYLEEDLRLDMDSFYKFNPNIFERYIDAGGRKSSTINTILNLLINHV